MERSGLRLPASALDDVSSAWSVPGAQADGTTETAYGGQAGTPNGDDSSPAEGGIDVGEAVRQADRLAALLRSLQQRERAAYRLDEETMQRIRRLEESARQVEEVHAALEDQLRIDLDDSEFATLESLLHAWTERPNDLLVMVKLAEQSIVLARVIAAYREIRRLLAAVDARGVRAE